MESYYISKASYQHQIRYFMWDYSQRYCYYFRILSVIIFKLFNFIKKLLFLHQATGRVPLLFMSYLVLFLRSWAWAFRFAFPETLYLLSGVWELDGVRKEVDLALTLSGIQGVRKLCMVLSVWTYFCFWGEAPETFIRFLKASVISNN